MFIIFSLLRVDLLAASSARPILVGGGVVVEVIIGYHYVYDFYALFLTIISATCSVFKLG